MSKNIIFIPNINLGNDRSDSYQYSINSWKRFADKYDCELFILEDLLYPVEDMKITWQRWHIFDILDNNDIDPYQICIVDADTIVHPDCPNFFEEPMSYLWAGVMNDGCYEWVNRSIRDYGNFLFDGKLIKPWRYLNNGFTIINNNHRDFCKLIIDFYWKNRDKIIQSYDLIKAATDQTIINFLREFELGELHVLPPCYNLQDLNRKNLLKIHPQQWWDDNLDNLYNSGWIYHFNAIPQNPMNRDANYWIKRVYEELFD